MLAVTGGYRTANGSTRVAQSYDKLAELLASGALEKARR